MLSNCDNNIRYIIPSLSAIILQKIGNSEKDLQKIKQIHASIIDFNWTEYKYVFYMNTAQVILNQVKLLRNDYKKIKNGPINSSIKQNNPLYSILLKFNSAYHSSKDIYVYGGFIRDYINGNIYNNIDIRFPSRELANIFMNHYIPRQYNVSIIDENVFESYPDILKCISIEIMQNKYQNYPIKINLTWIIYRDVNDHYFDFDVNMLLVHDFVYGGEFTSMFSLTNSECYLETVIENCQSKNFIVLTIDGKPLISHGNHDIHIIRNDQGEIINIENDIGLMRGEYRSLSRPHCISRSSEPGKLLLQKMDDMCLNGWDCLNEPCDNLWCVLAPKDLACEYEKYLEEKEMAFLEQWRQVFLENNIDNEIISDSHDELDEICSNNTRSKKNRKRSKRKSKIKHRK
ncbi:hypothetical protein QKC54_gp0196 [Megavirus baoshan]|uniref:Uncharacterized protein n=1 Tax=Megavirus baoshan TaxID=2496520 RepID=A0A3Q8U8G3_9VIRU|nr:hypothetical protein QKC54_gp0196 [Megavirus baoshan]AZL89726.1 hypothetical protein Mb0876 [Megavirus baoshan]